MPKRCSGRTSHKVVGFAFDTTGRVALLQTQNGLQGVEGILMPGENPDATMVRTFKETTNVSVTGWRLFAHTEDCDTYTTFYKIHNLSSITLDAMEQQGAWVGTAQEFVGLFEKTASANLLALLPLAFPKPKEAHSSTRKEGILLPVEECICSCHFSRTGLPIRHSKPCCQEPKTIGTAS